MEIEIASLGRAFLFLGIPGILGVFFLQWKWANTCEKNIRVLVAEKGGGGSWKLAPKRGGQISIHNPDTDEDRTWAVNELATIDVLYPGVGFVPDFMQKTIRLAIVNEGDWEPMLNRSPHREKVASPDVIVFMQGIAKQSSSKAKALIDEFLDGVSTGPTREMIADPATLGSLMRSEVLRALAVVSNDLVDTLKTINTRLTRFAGLNGPVVYIGLGILAALVIYVVFQITEITTAQIAIQNALGITVE